MTDITKGIIGLEGLILDEVMPQMYAYMLQTGQSYKTGSDYTQEQLNKPIEEYI